MKKLLLVNGKPGSGKSTVSELAAAQFNDCYYFSMGEEIRARGLDGKPSRYSTELEEYKTELRLHKPLPPHLAVNVFEECLEQTDCLSVIVDGYPQFPDRLPRFHESLERVGARVIATCMIDVSDEVATERMNLRAQRTADVTEDKVFTSKRLKSYYENAEPTIQALANQYPLRLVDGSQPINAVVHDLVAIGKEFSLS